MQDIMGLSLEELKGILEEWKFPVFHARQVWAWIYKKGAADFEAMSDLSADLRRKLKENFSISGLELVDKFKSTDGTEKFLLETKDKQLIEGVVIPAEGRITACLSTQAGCKFACCFCASGLLEFKRNLTAAEIINEAVYLKNHNASGRLTHIVFMGTGEPMDNYDPVLKAIRIINAPLGLNIGARRITVSTCGIIPGIKRLAEEDLQVELSVSLHAADDKMRSGLLPVNKKYPLKELLAACRDYSRKTKRQVTFEYVLIKGFNSGQKEAEKLTGLLKGFRLCKVNLIPANPVKELKIEPPNKLEVIFFRDYLLKHKIPATLRKSRGQDIAAACGQLRTNHPLPPSCSPPR